VVAHSLHPGRVHVVVNAVDTDVFVPRARAGLRQELGLSPTGALVAVVGRLDRNKGTAVALEGIARLTDVSAVVVGDGPDRGKLERLVDERGLGERVRFTGRRPQGEVARYMAAADLLVFPSRLAEAGPLVVAQALACGTPVVASNVGAVPEMLGEDEAVGVLVRPGSASDVAQAVERLLADPVALAAMKEAARARALERFTVDRMVDETHAVYRAAIDDADAVTLRGRARSRVTK
jgi:glycosyltransferase involved in cell wall biosynthesis